MNLFPDSIESKLTSIKKFYFLDYFPILLNIILKYNIKDEIYKQFVINKEINKLSVSKYRKTRVNYEDKISHRFVYTFNQVLEELELYKLIIINSNGIFLNDKGKDLQSKFESNNFDLFYKDLFYLMEIHHFGYYKLITEFYKLNSNGLWIFPIYSPSRLGILKKDLKTNQDIINYIQKQSVNISNDLFNILKINKNLESQVLNIINKLTRDNLLNNDELQLIDQNNYYKIIKRIRDIWLNYLIKDVYNLNISLSYFEIWCYRGKQFGLINITEFYPNFSGRMVYPISIITETLTSLDFIEFFKYNNNKKLFIHEPEINKIQEYFTKILFESYLELKKVKKVNFIQIADLREIVCFKIKISYKHFQALLESVYLLNLNNKTSIKISIESDKSPEESNLSYITREPVIINNKIRNIIAINLKNE